MEPVKTTEEGRNSYCQIADVCTLSHEIRNSLTVRTHSLNEYH